MLLEGLRWHRWGEVSGENGLAVVDRGVAGPDPVRAWGWESVWRVRGGGVGAFERHGGDQRTENQCSDLSSLSINREIGSERK